MKITYTNTSRTAHTNNACIAFKLKRGSYVKVVFSFEPIGIHILMKTHIQLESFT